MATCTDPLAPDNFAAAYASVDPWLRIELDAVVTPKVTTAIYDSNSTSVPTLTPLIAQCFLEQIQLIRIVGRIIQMVRIGDCPGFSGFPAELGSVPGCPQRGPQPAAAIAASVNRP